MNKIKTKASICAKLSFALALLFCILFFTTPFVIRFLSMDSPLLDIWVLSILTMEAIALVLGIVAVWKRNRETLSDRERRMAKGGLVLSGVFLLFAIASIISDAMFHDRHVPPDTVYCTSEIRLAGMALLLYQDEHGFFPVPSEMEKIVNREFPMDESRKRELELLEKQCPGHHFIYWRPQDSDLGKHIPLLADAEPYHKGKHFVYFLDGECKLLSPEEFEAIVPRRSGPQK